MTFSLRNCVAASALATLALVGGAQAQTQKPNVLVIMGDDIGYWNISAYNRGMMGYRTPNIDRIANEGAIFTDYYAQQSCTAGRAAFITGQSPIRTGLLKVGLPSAKEGLLDRTRRSPNCSSPRLRHRPVRQEPPRRPQRIPADRARLRQVLRQPLSPQRRGRARKPRLSEGVGVSELRQEFRPARVLKCVATATELRRRPALRAVGQAEVRGHRPDHQEAHGDVDGEFLDASLDFIDRANKDKKPFFVSFNSTRMHIFTHLKPESVGKTGLGVEADGMVEHDGMVGTLLKKLDDLGIADNTIVIYTTDNGRKSFSWPDGGTTPFRSEKNSNWEGGYRAPAMVRWPGVTKPHTEINGIFSSEDSVPTLTAACGEPNITQKLLDGYDAAGKTFKVHLDGYDQHDLLAGGPTKRKEFFYWTDDGDLAGLRSINGRSYSSNSSTKVLRCGSSR